MKSFVVAGGTLDAKPVNDTQLLQISFTLPRGFGYVLAEIHFNINVDRAADWNEAAEFLLSNPTVATAGVDYRMPLPMTLTANDGAILGVRTALTAAGTLSRIPITPASSGSFTAIRYANLTATVQAAGTVDAVVSLWEYDLEQLAWYYAHSAANVVSR